MTAQVHITSRHHDLDEETVSHIHNRAQNLIRSQPSIIQCRVVVDDPHHRRRKGRGYRVRVSVILSDDGGVSDHSSTATAEEVSPSLAVTHAFSSVKRQLTRRRHRPRRYGGVRGGRSTLRHRALREAARAEGFVAALH